jgi:hypothetical protein
LSLDEDGSSSGSAWTATAAITTAAAATAAKIDDRQIVGPDG